MVIVSAEIEPSNAPASFKTVKLLPQVGFEAATANKLEDWSFKLGPLELDVIEGPNKWFKPSVNFTGNFHNGREIAYVEFVLPEEVASENHALAMLAHFMSKYVATAQRPSWLTKGISLDALLPWK